MTHVHVAKSGCRGWWRRAGFSLGVGAWWLLVAGTVVLMLPAPTVAVPVEGETAHVNLPGLVHAYPSFPIPVERAAFDQAQRGYLESNEDAIEHAFAAYEWIAITHGQVIKVITRDGQAVEVELLDGPHAGRRGWLTARQLAP